MNYSTTQEVVEMLEKAEKKSDRGLVWATLKSYEDDIVVRATQRVIAESENLQRLNIYAAIKKKSDILGQKRNEKEQMFYRMENGDILRVDYLYTDYESKNFVCCYFDLIIPDYDRNNPENCRKKWQVFMPYIEGNLLKENDVIAEDILYSMVDAVFSTKPYCDHCLILYLSKFQRFAGQVNFIRSAMPPYIPSDLKSLKSKI